MAKLITFKNNNHFFVSGEWLPCGSPTCSKPECRKKAVARYEAALRYVGRFRESTLFTVSKVKDEKHLDGCYDTLLKTLRREGLDVQAFMVIETHKRGLLHAHIVVQSEHKLSDSVRLRAVAGVRSYLEESHAISTWTTIDACSRPAHAVAGYLLKNAKDEKTLKKHLSLNNGHLVRRHTRALWVCADGGVRSFREAYKEEAARGRAFHTLVSLVGELTADHLCSKTMRAVVIRGFVASERRRERKRMESDVREFEFREEFGDELIDALEAEFDEDEFTYAELDF